MKQNVKQLILNDIRESFNQRLNRVNADILRYRSNPLAFFHEKLDLEFWEGLQKVAIDLSAEVAGNGTASPKNPNHKRVSVVAGHGIGSQH